MTEVRQAREIDLLPEELRFQPSVKSDIIIQRRAVSLAPIEAAQTYTRDGTNTLTWNIQGHRELSQLLDSKSLYFTWKVKFDSGYPVEDVAMLVEEVIISSNGRTLERIRNAQYIQHFLRGYGMSRTHKAKLGKMEGFQCYEDRTIQYHKKEPVAASGQGQGQSANNGFGKMAQTGIDPNGFTLAEVNNGVAATRRDENLGYMKKQVSRTNATGVVIADSAVVPANDTAGNYALMKFKLNCSGLLSTEKMLPIGWCPLQIQLRLSDKNRACDNCIAATGFDYSIQKPRMHFEVCSVGQAYASALQQRLRGPGVTLNCKMFDTFFQIVKNDKQIVIPSNKQRLSKVWVMFHEEDAGGKANKSAFRSSVTGGPLHSDLDAPEGKKALQSYQFQVGTEVSEAVTLEKSSGDLNPTADNTNTGLAYLQAYLKAIGAVNGEMQKTEFWGSDIQKYKCNDWEGGDLLQTFLSKYFCCVYNGEKLIGSQIETGVDTESGKDIVVDLRWADGGQSHTTRVMVLIQYHAQLVIKENDVSLSY